MTAWRRLQELLDPGRRALDVLGRVVDLAGVEDAVAPAADVDERGLHAGKHVLHPAEVDVADHRGGAHARDVVLDEHVLLEDGDLVALAVLGDHHDLVGDARRRAAWARGGGGRRGRSGPAWCGCPAWGRPPPPAPRASAPTRVPVSPARRRSATAPLRPPGVRSAPAASPASAPPRLREEPLASRDAGVASSARPARRARVLALGLGCLGLRRSPPAPARPRRRRRRRTGGLLRPPPRPRPPRRRRLRGVRRPAASRSPAAARLRDRRGPRAIALAVRRRLGAAVSRVFGGWLAARWALLPASQAWASHDAVEAEPEVDRLPPPRPLPPRRRRRLGAASRGRRHRRGGARLSGVGCGAGVRRRSLLPRRRRGRSVRSIVTPSGQRRGAPEAGMSRTLGPRRSAALERWGARAADGPARRASCDVAHPVRVPSGAGVPRDAASAAGAVARLLDARIDPRRAGAGRRAGLRRGYQ